MAPINSQRTRAGRLKTPLPEDALALLEFSGTEAVNDLFSFTLRALSEDGSVDFDQLLGKRMNVAIKTIEGTPRYFDGIVTAAAYLGRDDEGHVYEFEISPWLWLLGRRRNSRIFHERTVAEIIAEVVAGHGGLPCASDTEYRLSGAFPMLEYTVQYRESDLDFLRRLMEEFGISFHFEMEEERHILVLSNSSDGFSKVPGRTRPYRAVSRQHRATAEHFQDWKAQRRVTTGVVRLTDYDFKNPTTNMEVTEAKPLGYDHADLESYDYPGRYAAPGDGRDLAKRRIEGQRAQDSAVDAGGDVVSLGAGHKVDLTGHSDEAVNVEYLCTRAHHHYRTEGYRSGLGGPGEEGYRGRYRLLRTDAPFAPPLVTPRAQVQGPQTGVVIGSGEIDCDEFGRILVMFHWDSDRAGSMRCRVAQSWSGNAWGSIYIPRVGMEVVVEFLEGDPDRPLVTGAVYNARNMPPFDLPGDKTISGVKSYSTPGGGGYNSLTFEDKSGSEVIDMHAQKDLTVLVENNETREVKVNHASTIGGTSSVEVTGDATMTVKSNRSSDISGTETVTADKDITIDSQTKITLVCGASTIEMTPAKITISSPEVDISGTAKLKTFGGTNADHTAGGPMTIAALVVKIN
jgi:type VI secretion system secreted protein VgrG